jgi:glc operon protein GlcG
MLSNPVRSSTRPLMLGLLALVLASGLARGQAASNVVDGAGMFSDEAIRRVKADLSRIERAHGVAVTVETTTSLKGEAIGEVAARRAERLGHKGLFILIAEKEHKDEVLALPKSLLDELGKARLAEIRDAITEEFRRGKYDDGLIKGVQAAEKVLIAIRPAPAPTRPAPSPSSTGGGFLPTMTPEGSSWGDSPLVLRQQVRLSLAGARKAIEGAEAKATKEGWKMNIAVVDDGGHLLAFGRMDGARPASVATSTTKAVSAATYRQATGPIAGPGSNAGPDLLLSLSLQDATGGKVTTLLGGVPIVVDGQVIGAIGVGGGTGEQDLETARAGLAAFLEGLKAKPEEPKDKPKPKDGEGESTTKPAEPDAGPK